MNRWPYRMRCRNCKHDDKLFTDPQCWECRAIGGLLDNFEAKGLDVPEDERGR